MRIPGKNQDIPIRLKFIEERTDGVGHGPLLCSGIDSNTLSAKNYYALTKVSRPVKTLKTYKNKDVAVEQTFEPASKVSWIRISKHPDPKIKKKLNRLLNTQWQIEVFDALSRLGRGTHVSSRWIADISQQKISARLINDRVLSIEERVWVHYPMDSITRSVSIGINLDLVRGEMITVKDIFTSEYFSDAPSAITNWVKEGYTDTFAKHIHEYLKNAGDEKLERCFDLDMRRDRTEIWLDTSGVWFSRYYLNDATPECRKPIFLPYRVLRKGLTKSALRLLGNNVKRTGIPQQPELPPSTPYPLDQISPDDIFKPNGKQYPIF